MPTPASKTLDKSRNRKEGTNSQKERLFKRGKAMSATPSIRGISQLPKPPIEIGMTMKKIMMKAWAVTTTLYRCSSPRKGPTVPNSKRIKRLILKPIKPAHIPNRK